MAKVSLKNISPGDHSFVKNKDDALKKTAVLQKKLYDLLYLMFAYDQHSLLVILQGIDTAGKDGAVQHIFAGANAQGIKVFSFKRPSLTEFRHDFLWRCHLHTPECGVAVIFNRSYYEEVTTAMVHPDLLIQQHIPESIRKRKDFYERRYDRINDFEKLLTQKGTLVVKFFLHISKQEQKIRLNERLKNRRKNWKFSLEDMKERKHWDKYMSSFQKMIDSTSTKHAPWTLVPADNKWYRDYLISKTLVGALEKLKMSYPRAAEE